MGSWLSSGKANPPSYAQDIPKGMFISYTGKVICDPATKDDLCRALARLKNDPDGFMIVGSDAFTYIQTTTRKGGGFLLEYQDGTRYAHYIRKNDQWDDGVDFDTVERAFHEYFEGKDDKWKDPHLWLDMELWRNKKIEMRIRHTRMASTPATTPVTLQTIIDGIHGQNDG